MVDNPRPPDRFSSGAGFSLIELLVTITIVGILASVAIPSFIIYMRKARTTEMYEGLEKVCTGAKVYFANHEQFPPDTLWAPVMTHEQRCDSGLSAFPPQTRANFNTPAWQSLMFTPGINSRYRYQWVNESDLGSTPIVLQGFGWAVGDLDCDTKKSIFKVHLRKVGSNPMTRNGTFLVFGEETE